MYHSNKQRTIIFLFCWIVFLIAIAVIFSNKAESDKKANIKSFNNGEVLVCHRTLIVSNSNWKVVDGNLINDNTAGYVNIQNCEVQK